MSAGCFCGTLLDFAVTMHYCSVGPALQDSTAGLCLRLLCVALICRGTRVKSCFSVPGSTACSLCSFHGLWIRQPGRLLLLAAAYDAKHSNFTAAVNGSCPVTSSPQELAHKGLGEMRESESAMYGLCIPAECSFLHHGK